MPVADSAFHWQPVLSTKKMPSAHGRSGTRGRPPPKRCVFLCSGKSGSINPQSSSLIVKRVPVLSMRLARGRERGLTSSAAFIAAKATTKAVIRIGIKDEQRLGEEIAQKMFVRNVGKLHLEWHAANSSLISVATTETAGNLRHPMRKQ
jgi:hypothetical protein